MHAPMPHDFVPVSLSALRANLDRVLPIFGATFAEMMEFNHWSICWPLAAVAFIYLLFYARESRLLVTFVVIIAPIVAYDSMYLFSASPDYRSHIASSLPRLLLQVMPATWLAVALALGLRRDKEAAPRQGLPQPND
jgi:hypothetical protein